ncbi:hypothetical protein F1C58_04225 [Glaciihabitans sp. INWT7]|uniref:alpha-amylase family glycosyl hydrolase n=1 Tax=Glaciihabitans sp. INWT7 TaxID=2596912 RepID=UPI001625EEED|nr:alpha-amylase family glycosyl hydrolase [Glaciihabitans sp. INWT7]QNE46192.1 hypothetical protein F1C58_04225 [Glaciihabitans sp. INWT7]
MSAPDLAVVFECSITIVAGGTEHRGSTGGLEYRSTSAVSLAGPLEQIRGRVELSARVFEVPVGTSDSSSWTACWRYEFRQHSPRIAISLQIFAETNDAVARNVHIDLGAVLTERDIWHVHSPGNQLRTNLPLRDLTHSAAISPAAGLKGSIGLVAFDRTDIPFTCVVWPLSVTEIGDISVLPTEVGASVHWQTDVAGQPGEGAALSCSTLFLDLVANSFQTYLSSVPAALARMGITSPNAVPAWAAEANIYEVQIGFSVFDGGFQYSPYPTAEDLLADLDRIQSLGYNTLQIMPRQPYPSYNVHDFDDITTSYGDEKVLRALIVDAHSRGMKVIVDILLHGVIDGESVRQAIDAIRSGPYANRLDEDQLDNFSLDVSEDESYLIAWSRHLIDFEQYWIGGSPEHHPLIDQHPEWFCRDSEGNVTGIYTKAFDVAHPGWQRYFIDSALSLVTRLDIDGFRFDAPTYNYFSNWSGRTRENAAVSTMGCLPLFDQLRVELKALKPEALLYTEPSGVLHRQAMDLNYNYDEHWLIGAVMMNGAGNTQWVRNARELGQWWEEKDASLPIGSMTAHHIDSHDTFWWPLPGRKWRREQFGSAATAAWMTVFALSGGPYMTFVGGEVSIEGQVRAINRVRREHPEFVLGISDYSAISCDDEHVYSVVRRGATQTGLCLVNLSENDRTVLCVLQENVIGDPVSTVTTRSLLDDSVVVWTRQDGGWITTITLAAYQSCILSL